MAFLGVFDETGNDCAIELCEITGFECKVNLLEALPVCTFCCTLMAPAKCVDVRDPNSAGKGKMGK